MYRKTFIIIALLLAVFAPAGLAQAHILETDQAITGLLHVEPDDQPVAKQPTPLFFVLSDSTNKFQFKNCDCEVAFYSGTQKLDSDILDVTEGTIAATSFNFPAEGQYHVVLTGKPLTAAAFQPFTLTFPVDITRQAVPQRKPYLIGFLLGILTTILLGLVVLWKRSQH